LRETAEIQGMQMKSKGYKGFVVKARSWPEVRKISPRFPIDTIFVVFCPPQ
jgi:hypothetical protein